MYTSREFVGENQPIKPISCNHEPVGTIQIPSGPASTGTVLKQFRVHSALKRRTKERDTVGIYTVIETYEKGGTKAGTSHFH